MGDKTMAGQVIRNMGFVPDDYYRFDPPVKAIAVPMICGVAEIVECEFDRGQYVHEDEKGCLFKGKPIHDQRSIKAPTDCQGEDILAPRRASYFHVPWNSGSKITLDSDQNHH